MARNALLLFASSACLLACSASGESGSLVVGRDGTGGAGSGGGTGGWTASPFEAGTEPLSAHVESPKGVTVTIITLSCAGSCADVEAVATGGFSPYTFTWEDGSTNPSRTVCPTSSTDYRVSVTDTGSRSVEFHRDPETATASVTATVLDCPGTTDGGARSDGGGPIESLCIQNPSFEGAPQVNPLVPWNTAKWNPCPAPPNAGVVTNETASTSSSPYPTPTDGNTYGVVSTNSGFGGAGILAQSLCAPIDAGNAASFTVDMAVVPWAGSAVTAKVAQVQIFGGTAECTESEVLWTSPPLTPTFTTFCVTLRPSARTSSLSFHPLGDGNPFFNGLMTAAIDHIVPVARCPE